MADAETARQIGMLTAQVEHMRLAIDRLTADVAHRVELAQAETRDRLDAIDQRLDRGDLRFKGLDEEKAAQRAREKERRLALRIGWAVLAGLWGGVIALAAGAYWLMSHAKEISAWIQKAAQ